MADSQTGLLPDGTNRLTKPEIGGSKDTWGNKWNANADLIATNLSDVSAVANAALPKAGGETTGKIRATGGVRLSYGAANPTPVGNGDIWATSSGTFTYINGTTRQLLDVTGGTLTGMLTLSAAPTADLHAATKKYVDDSLTNATFAPSKITAGGATLGQVLTWSGAAWVPQTPGSATPTGVTSFNTRTGAVTLSGADVTGALGYTPIDPTTGGTISGAMTYSGNVSYTGTTASVAYSGSITVAGTARVGATIALSGAGERITAVATGTQNVIVTKVGNNSAYSLVCADSNGDQQFAVLGSGNTRIGTLLNIATAGEALAVRSTATQHAIVSRVGANTYDLFAGYDASGTRAFYVRGDGAVYAKFLTNDPASTTGFTGAPVKFLSTSDYALEVSATGTIAMAIKTQTSGSDFISFFHGSSNTYLGGIKNNGTSIGIPTTSDYRLKDNIETFANGLDVVKALRPVAYNWKADPSAPRQVGFLAHEAQPVLPQAVYGAKDAVDENGVIKPQGVDYAQFVPALTAAIKELEARVVALEAA